MTQDAGSGSAIAQTPRFDVAMRGYERSQVDEHLARLNQEINRLNASLRQEREFARTGSQQLVAERDEALQHLAAAQEELAALRVSGDFYDEAPPATDEISVFGDHLRNILTVAEQEARAVTVEVREEADRRIAEATEQAQAQLSEANEQADSLLSRAKKETDTLRAEARREATRLIREAGAEADRMVAAATQEATTTMDAARREESDLKATLADLVRRREQLRRQLMDIGSAIAGVLGGEDREAEPVRAADGVPDTGDGVGHRPDKTADDTPDGGSENSADNSTDSSTENSTENSTDDTSNDAAADSADGRADEQPAPR